MNTVVPAAADPLRVDVASARRQSSARRRPTRDVEAGHDPERDGIVAEDPSGGAFDSTWSMSGRTPPQSSAAQPVSQKPAAVPAAAPNAPVPTAPVSGDPRVVGRATALARADVASRAAPHAGPRSGPSAAPASRVAPMNKHVCPFCGTRRDDPLAECPACGLPDTEETRGATVARVGPWFVLQARNPSAPGMRFNVLRELVLNGQITAGSIVRGPATHQLWTYAARVRGLAHIFGVCWSCNRRLPNPAPGEDADDFCVYCGALQSPPTNPDQQLEALETSETIGTGLSNKAGQVAQMRPGGGHNRPHLQGDAAAGQIQFRETTMPAQQMARRPHIPRPLPPAPRDGGDALLTTRELATAFNLDRKRSILGPAGSLPWGRILLTVLALAMIIFAIWFAMGPISEMLGLGAQETTEPDIGNVVPGE
jgi:hypothetical protein